jgi:hypothetical protein
MGSNQRSCAYKYPLVALISWKNNKPEKKFNSLIFFRSTGIVI